MTVQETRKIFNSLIGEIIEKTLGIDAVSKLFEAAEYGDSDALNKIANAGATGKAPSGFLAVDLGFVDVETKEALLTAQAAERTLLSIEAMENFYAVDYPALQNIVSSNQNKTGTNPFYSPFKPVVEAYYQQHVKPADVHNRAFQFIGTKGEGDALVLAQATQQLAAEYLRNEQLGIKYAVLNNPLRLGNFQPLGLRYMDGFKQSIALSYKNSADTLRNKSGSAVADNIEDVIASITWNEATARKHTPKRFAETARWLQHRLAQKEANLYLDQEVRDVREIAVPFNWNETMTVRSRQALGLVV